MTEYLTTTPLQTRFTRTIVEQATLRDQFAMAALTGLLTALDSGVPAPTLAKEAYEAADAMLAAREQKK